MNDEINIPKKFWPQIKNLKHKNWLNLAEKLKLPTTTPSGGTSHIATIRHPKHKDSSDPRYLQTIPVRMHHVANSKVFKKLRSWGISEDNMLKGLGLKK